MFYDKKTGQPLSGAPDEVQKKILSGEAVVKGGTKAVNIVDADGNAAGSANVEDLPTLFQEGYRVETPTEKVVNDYVDENKGIGGALKVGVGQFVDEALMGIPELIADKTQSRLDVAKREALKKEHAAVNAIGGTLGFGVSALGTGGGSAAGKAATTIAKFNPAGKLFTAAETAGKAAEKYVAEKLAVEGVEKGLSNAIASKAAGLGVEGAMIATPQAITEAAFGDPDDAAETLMAGGILGGALGATVPVLKKVAKLGKDKAENYLNLKNIHEDSALSAIGATPAQKFKLQEKSPDVVEKLADFLNDITKDSRKDLLNINKLNKRVQDAEEFAGQAIGFTLQKFDEKLMPLYNAADDVVKAEIKNGMFDFKNLKDEITEKFITPYDGDPLYRAQIAKVKDLLGSIDYTIATKFGGDAKPLSFKIVRDYQQAVNSLITDAQRNKEMGMGTQSLEFFRDKIQTYFKELSPKLKEAFPEMKAIADEFKRANDQFRVATSVSDIIARAEARADAKPLVGFMDAMTAAAGAGIGGLPGLAAGMTANKIKDYANKLYQVGGLLLTEETFKGVAKKLDGINSALRTYTVPMAARTAIKISDITGNKDDDNYDKLSEKIVAFNQAPEASKLVSDLDALSQTGAPQIADQAKIKTAEAMQYLANLMPKPLTPNNPLVKNKKYKPSDMEMAKFNRQVRTALDPFTAIDDLNNNTLTKDQVQVLADLYPNILSEIQSKVYDAVAENPAEVPYNKRIKLSLLLGLDLDPSLDPTTANIIQSSQEAVAPEQQQAPAGNPNAKFTTYPTETQRITNNLK